MSEELELTCWEDGCDAHVTQLEQRQMAIVDRTGAHHIMFINAWCADGHEEEAHLPTANATPWPWLNPADALEVLALDVQISAANRRLEELLVA